jgi:hypothetical protein
MPSRSVIVVITDPWWNPAAEGILAEGGEAASLRITRGQC